MKAFLLTLIFMSLIARLPVANADAKACSRDALAQIFHHRSDVLLKTTRGLRSELLKGYVLPEGYKAGYYARRIEPYLSKPQFRAVEDPKVLYRGMFLSADDLEKILVEGMDLKRVNWVAAGGGISFSSSEVEAATYIFHAADRTNGIGVVFEVKMSDDMIAVDDAVLNSTHTIFKKHSNLPRDQISNVYIWGQWGLESIESIAQKAADGKIGPHQDWTGVFDQTFSR